MQQTQQIMMRIHFIPTAILFIVIASCKSPSSEIKDAFDKVNKSITISAGTLEDSVFRIFNSIDTSRQMSAILRAKADSIYLATNNAYHFIDSMKQIMQSKDTSGTDLDLAENIFLRTSAGSILVTKLQAVYKMSYFSLADDSKRTELDNIWEDFSMSSNSDWTSTYFKGTPTIAAITILNKFKNDCINAAKVSLNSIYNQQGK